MRVIVACLVAATAAAALAQESQPVVVGKIPEVTSLVELRKLEPISSAGDWLVRVGLADAGPAADGHWRLLCVHVTYDGQDKSNKHFVPLPTLLAENAVGPLSWDLTHNPQLHRQLRAADIQKRLLREQSGEYGHHGGHAEELFIAAVPMSRGKHLRVFDSQGELLAQSELAVMSDPEHPWLIWLDEDRAKERTQERAGQLLEGRYALTLKPVAVVPKYPEEEPIWVCKPGDEKDVVPAEGMPGQVPQAMYDPRYFASDLDREQRRACTQPARWAELWAASQPATATSGPATTTPATAPTPKRELLRLQLQDGRYVVAASFTDFDATPHQLLARWWINGKPVTQTVRSKLTTHVHGIGKMSDVQEMQHKGGIGFAAVLPPFLGTVKPGDRIELQLMYCGSGLHTLGIEGQNKRLHDYGYPALAPVLSNKLQFEATAELIEKSGRLAQPASQPAGQPGTR